MPDRAALSTRFLLRCGWEKALRAALAGDASARSYERLVLGGRRAVLMDAPPEMAEDTGAFVRVARHLSGLGLSAPEILAEDHHNGFLLLEDLGDDLFARLVERDAGLETTLYETAVDALVHLQSVPPCPDLPELGPNEWAEAACFAIDWYRFAVVGEQTGRTPFRTILADLIAEHANGPRVMILRDYHAENLIWLPRRKGPARVGLLDFQLAQLGQPCYDLVSLCQDARREVASETERCMKARFAGAVGAEEHTFAVSYATFGAQRALRILGVFSRLSLVSGKPGYVSLIPRVWAQLQRNLSHPALAPLARICADLLPEPTGQRLERIRDQCGSQKR